MIETKCAVEHLRDRRALEAFVLHHVAPVARRVADGQEDRLVLASRPGERVLAPRIPVDRVVLVLEKIGALFGGETIRHFSDYALGRDVTRARRALTDRIPLAVARAALLSLHLRCRLSIRSCGEGWLERKASTLLWVAPRLPCEHLEQLDHPAPTPPGAREDRHPCLVGLAFFVAVELQKDAAGQHTGRGLRSSAPPVLPSSAAQQPKAPLRDHALA